MLKNVTHVERIPSQVDLVGVGYFWKKYFVGKLKWKGDWDEIFPRGIECWVCLREKMCCNNLLLKDQSILAKKNCRRFPVAQKEPFLH